MASLKLFSKFFIIIFCAYFTRHKYQITQFMEAKYLQVGSSWYYSPLTMELIQFKTSDGILFFKWFFFVSILVYVY